MEQGNLSNAKGVGAGVTEYRINFGPGYRVYGGKDGDTLIILLGGGRKKRQGEAEGLKAISEALKDSPDAAVALEALKAQQSVASSLG